MKIVASIQARMNSSRFPGKVLQTVCGKPLLLWQVERLRNSRLIDEVIVATSKNKLDRQIFDFCSTNNIKAFIGSEDNVLDRVANLIAENNAEIHVECFGDSPLIDPELIDQFLGYFLKRGKIDFLSNTLTTTYPAGMETIVYYGSVLQELNAKLPATDPLREHAGYNITRFRKKYFIENIEAPSWYYYPNLHLEVDEPVDMLLITEIISYFEKLGLEFYNLSKILDFIRLNPNLAEINNAVERRWKDLKK